MSIPQKEEMENHKTQLYLLATVTPPRACNNTEFYKSVLDPLNCDFEAVYTESRSFIKSQLQKVEREKKTWRVYFNNICK